MAQPEPVSVLGAGSVGATLARALARAGRTVTVGVRHPDAEQVRALVAELGGRATATTPGEALRASRIVIAAVPGPSLPELVDEHATELAGRVVIDATNNLSGDTAAQGMSALPRLAEVVPSAFGYRAFNSVGWENMADPVFDGVVADMCFSGPADERAAVESVIADVGFRPQYVGAGPDALRAVDALATLWFALAFGQQRGRRLALRLLTDAAQQL